MNLSLQIPDTSDACNESGQDDGLAELARRIVSRLSSRTQRQDELLGEAFLTCERLRRGRPDEFESAAARGELESWCIPHVRRALRHSGLDIERVERPRGGWLGAYVGPDAREVGAETEYSGCDEAALDTSQLALRKALARAQAEGNGTLLRNLGWYRERLEHRSYEAIANSAGRVPATIRTGVARARKFVLRIVHELEHEQPAPLSADAPAEIEPLRQLWKDQQLDVLERELARTESEFGSDPHWLNLRALASADRGDRAAAHRYYERALIQADGAPVRARILNNLANLRDDEGALDEARILWMRAHQLAPTAATPVLNLLAAASVSQDYASAQHFVSLLGELLSCGRMREQERAYAHRRLRENPRFGWLRETEAWRLGPARWLRAASDDRARNAAVRGGGMRRGAAALAIVCFSLLGALATPLAAAASINHPAVRVLDGPSLDRSPGEELVGIEAAASASKRGGDSMGSPSDRGGSSRG